MDILDAIRGRRTIKNFTGQAVPEDLLRRILEAGTWAQNHGLTQPWRFIILGAETRGILADIHEASRHKILGPRPLVVVSSMLAADPKVRREDLAATACAVQNIALAAWAEGIGMLWGSGRHVHDERTYRVLGLDPDAQEILGFLSFGYPESLPPAPARKPLEEVVRVLP